ncbi:MAG TPA: prepilin-type N-terminal cleavage/methylation domain-containing protein [Candidatus Acidoferrum sp.]|nr:prepilin-type N-terminal cleavage/methylation domain-containing protein [Candidatus Acidoferrum sp.]
MPTHLGQQQSARRTTEFGFTLIELMIAMAVFVIVAGAAFTLFNKQAQLVTHQQNLSAVNIGLRNAMAQMEMDLSGSALDLFRNVPVGGVGPNQISLGVIVQNNVAGAPGVANCAVNTSTWAYPISSACFDSLEIMGNPKACSGCTAANTTSYPNIPVLVSIDSSADNTSSGSAIYVVDATPSPTDTVSNATIASNLVAGDELLIMNANNKPTGTPPSNPPVCQSGLSYSDQSSFCMTVITLTSNAVVASSPACPNSYLSCIKLPSYHATSSNGTPTTLDDPLGIMINALAPNGYNYYNAISPTYGPFNSANQGYVIDLGSAGSSSSIWYAVEQNPANSSDTQLVRCVGAPCAPGTGQVLTDQVVGFKVGTALWNADPNVTETDLASYSYNAAQYCNGAIWQSSTNQGTPCATAPTNNDPFDFSLIRSIRVSLIARTTPNMDPALPSFKNGFDNGPYLVQQSSVVVDLRNMSNLNFGN